MNKENKISLKRKLYRKICALLGHYMPDQLYLNMLYEVRLNNKLNIKNPRKFNEKLQWLKLYDRNPLYTKMADKYEVRKIIESKIGQEYLIPLLGVWNSSDEIDWESLPNQFVLKCTHDSASVCICKDKSTFSKKDACIKLDNSLDVNYFYASREWPYKNIKPKIIAEKYMVDESGSELKDYKIFTFGGEPYLIQVDFDRFKNHRRNLYTIDWKYIDEEIEYPKDPTVQIIKPEKLDEMLQCAKILAQGSISLRVDFYSINSKIYFGEMTFYQEAGFGRFSSEVFEEKLGDLINLPSNN